MFAGRGPELYDHFGRLRPGQPEEFVDALLWSDSAELIGAGYSVDQAVKDPNSPIHLDVIVDPAGVDKDEYERRLAKYKNVYYFRHELEFLRRQNMAVDNRTANELKRRATMPADELLALMGKKKAVRTGGNAS